MAQSVTSKDGQGSQISERLCREIVQQFKNNITQCKIIKKLGLLPSADYYYQKIQ